MPSPVLSARWIRMRQAHWQRLDALVASCGRQGVRTLSHAELRELALLYRQTAADLAAARAEPSSAALARQLNQLLARAHNLVYVAQPQGPRGIWRFYTRVFPEVFRATWRYTAAATSIFVAGALAGLLLCLSDPGFERFILGAAMIDTIERREMWTHSILAVKPLASSGIMTNNLAVSFAAFATGLAGGLGTVYMMAFNGLLIGVIGSACARAGLSVPLWSFVAPHGSLELPAIFLAGGAGLILAHGVLAPGLLSRRDALAQAGALAIRLVLGVIPLLVVAGIIEGFISPTPLDASLKFTIGAGLFVLLLFYLLGAGRARVSTPNFQLPTPNVQRATSSPEARRR